MVLNRGKGNSGADATKGQGRHQRAANPKAQVSGLVENRNSFLTRADEKSLPIIKTVRLGEGVWRMMYFVSPSQWHVLKAVLKQTLSVQQWTAPLIFFFGQRDRRTGWNVWCVLIIVHREEASKTQITLATSGIFLSMGYLNIYILKKESSLFALHTRDFLASLNSKGF